MTRILLALATLTLATGCHDEPKPKLATRSSIKVQLPPPPSLEQKPYVSAHPDGVLTVEGLLRERDDHLGKVVKVRGVVAKLSKCPEPPAPEPAADAGASDDAADVVAPPRPPRTCDPPPHAYLVDSRRQSKRELLVYGSMWSALADYEVGASVDVEGNFDIVTRDGVFLRQVGLLQLDDLPQPEPTSNAADEGPEE